MHPPAICHFRLLGLLLPTLSVLIAPLAPAAHAADGSPGIAATTAVQHDANTAPKFRSFPPGIAITDIAANSDEAHSVAIQADGKILAAGSSYGSRRTFALARYNADGSLDTAFGNGGKLTTAVGSREDEANGVTVQADGKILVVGQTHKGSAGGIVLAGLGGYSTDWDIALIRYNADGSLDTTFHSDGKATTTFGSRDDFGEAVAVQADGKILVAGSSGSGITLVRYDSGGRLDTTFGSGGGVITNITTGSADYGRSLALQPDGKILVAGSHLDGAGYDFALVRYNANGSLDTGFGSGGKLTTAVGAGNDNGYSVALQPDGRILLAGASSNGSRYDFSVVRYLPDGSLDTSFGGSGKVTTAFGEGDSFAQSVAVQADGRIVLVGSSRNGNFNSAALARYNSDGSLDTTFGGGGKLSTPLASSSNAANGVALQADGKIVVAGTKYDNHASGTSGFMIIRYNSDGTLDESFGVPPVAELGGYYVEDRDPIVLGPTLYLRDQELDAANAGAGDYAGASVTLARQGGANADDVFGFAAAGADFSMAGNTLQVGGRTFATFSQAGGILAIRFTSEATIATRALVLNVLEHVTYRNASDAPPASVRIDWTVDDGGAQGPGGALGTSAGTTVQIAPMNDGPVLTASQAALAAGTEDTAYTVSAAELLAGHTDADGDTLAIADLSADHGSVAADGQGSYTVTPTAHYHGPVVLSYHVVDGVGGSVAATQSIELAARNDAPTFAGRSGATTTSFDGDYAAAYGIAVQADGKIWLAGGRTKLALARYNTDGSIDTGFGHDGKVTSQVGDQDTVGYALALQDDGKALVAGQAGSDIVVVRYNNDGSPDASFGNAGFVVTDLGADEFGNGIALQADGKIVVAGSSGNNFVVVRYNRDGTPDASFGNAGSVTTAVGSDSAATSLAIQADGKIVAAGYSIDGLGQAFALARYNIDGSLDASFGTGGKVTTRIGLFGRAHSVIVQADGKILAAGDFALVRYNGDGSLDTGFGGAGTVTNAASFSSFSIGGKGVALQDDGKILVVSVDDSGLSLVRYNHKGSLDTINEWVSTPGPGSSSNGHGIALLAEGKILVAASRYNGFGLLRYNGDGSLDPGFGDPSDGSSAPAPPSYIIGSPPVALDSVVSIRDIDLDAANNYDGASLTLARHGGANGEDRFYGSGSLSLGDGQVAVSGIVVGSSTQNDGRLVIDFNSQATSLLVAQVLRQLAYSNASPTPPTAVQIDWLFTDGNRGAQGFGDALGATATTAVRITHAPALTEERAVLPNAAEDVPYVVRTADLLAGFSDRDGDRLSVLNLRADGGVVANNGNDSYTVTPTANRSGTVTLDYDIADGNGGSIAATQRYSIAAANDAPAWGYTGFGDPTDVGKVSTVVGVGNASGSSAVLQPDGKMLVAGTSSNGGNRDFALVRYNRDGSLDTTFGTGGKVTTDFGTHDNVGGIALQADGRVLVSGDSGGDFALVRYKGDGSLDSGFGTGGKVTTGGFPSFGRSVTVQADGKILVAGGSWTGDFALVRYQSDGTLDTGFGTNGAVTTDVGEYSASDSDRSVRVQADGKILVLGAVRGRNFALVRYNSDGSLDTGFKHYGKLTPTVGPAGNIEVEAVTQQPDGKILVAGYISHGNSVYSIGLARYNADGLLDTGFGNAGVVSTFAAGEKSHGYSAVVQADGKILVAGDDQGKGNGDILLARYNGDGSPDASFGVGGRVTVDFDGKYDFGSSIVVQADGRILVAGTTNDGSKSRFALVRYNSDGSLDANLGRPTYFKNDPPARLDPAASVHDADLDTAGSYNGATLTLARHGGANAADIFSGSGNLSLSNGRAVLSGIDIGTVDNGSGTLNIVFGQNATPARVNEAIASIAYTDHGETPPVVVQIDWTFSDGNRGDQGSGGALAASRTTQVNVTTIPALALDATSLVFAARYVGAISAPQTVTLANVGETTLYIGAIGVSGDFAIAHDCNGPLAPSASCTLGVTFAPTVPDGRTGALTIVSDARDGPHVVTLAGVGKAIADAHDTQPPTVPAGLQAASASAAHIELRWSASDDNGVGVAQYLLYRDGEAIGSLSRTSYADTGLTALTTYRYAVAACDLAGNCSARSAELAATTGDAITNAAPALHLAAGWNLAGNGVEAPITVAATFADAASVVAIWKWVPAGSTPGIVYPTWGFYTPTLDDNGQAYAASKGYEFLTTINAGEGFWVNANTAFSASLPLAAAVQSSSFMLDVANTWARGGSRALPSGWSLIATGDNPTPRGFNEAVASSMTGMPPPGRINANVTTLWAWDAGQSRWYFWAPSLVERGALVEYLASHGHLDFATLPTTPTGTLSLTTGFWVNVP